MYESAYDLFLDNDYKYTLFYAVFVPTECLWKFTKRRPAPSRIENGAYKFTILFECDNGCGRVWDRENLITGQHKDNHFSTFEN